MDKYSSTFFLTLAAFLLALLSNGANAGERKALVFGNLDYSDHGRFSDLETTLADAEKMAKLLREGGFQVAEPVLNGSRIAMEVALEAFAKSLSPGDEAVVYFAGHGIQYENKIWLMGTNAEFRFKSKLGEEAISHETILATLGSCGVKIAVVILDCCREAPGQTWLASEIKKRGLRNADQERHAKLNPPKNILVGYATSSRRLTNDLLKPDDENGPLVTALSEHWKAGLEWDALWKKVTRDVYKRSLVAAEKYEGAEVQMPSKYGSTIHDFFFSKAVPIPVIPLSPVDPFAGRKAGESKRNNLGMSLRWCPPGEFWMGSPESEDGREDLEVRHRVKLSKGFWMGQTEVTQGEWQSIMGRSLLDQARIAIQSDEIVHWADGKKETYRAHYNQEKDADPQSQVGDTHSDIPIYMISWDDAMEFLKKLTARERAAGRLPAGWKYTLPSEAQWEYACRAETDSAIYTGRLTIKGERNGPELDEIAWYGGNSSEGFKGRGTDTKDWKEKQYPGGKAFVRKVGEKEANAWGLQDMLGNLWEWTGDWHEDYSRSFVIDPTGSNSGTYRVVRGGGWFSDALHCRAAFRYGDPPSNRFSSLGFRVAVSSIQDR